MTNTVDQGVAWMIAHPTRQNVPGATPRAGLGWSWSQLCVALVYWAMGASHTYPSATTARENSTIVSTSLTPPNGAIGWFHLGAAGHVGFFRDGFLFCASQYVNNLGTAIGYETIAAYEKASGATWLGWGWDFGGQTFSGPSTAGTGTVTPISAGDEDMIVIRNVDGEIGVLGEFTYTAWTATEYALLGPLYPAFVQVTQAQHDAAIAQTVANRAKLPAGTGTTTVTGVTQAQVQAITDAQTTLINTNLSSLWNSISGAFTTLASKFLPLATTAQVQALTPAAVPTAPQIAAEVVSEMGKALTNG